MSFAKVQPCCPGLCVPRHPYPLSGCQAHRVQADGGSVHVWGAFHNSAKSPLVLPDGYLTGVLYRGILQNTLVPFARHHFGDNYRYQDDNATQRHTGEFKIFPNGILNLLHRNLSAFMC